ncbi:hypothetical protein LSUE1_G004431 [Lachnellula suecica]|uniref:Arylsulfotransferase n=1 Tax=Lachnellula suecica TaxID=602035 RepID=A0A8T9C7S0_9HELO|nr:hypothetical protein LSUE1_G004431 [Lachnellula suecica]
MRSLNLFFVAALHFIYARADFSVFTNDDAYDAAEYGLFPIQTYTSTDLVSPRLNILQSSPECDASLFTFLSPRGGAVSDATATILDQSGHLVWTIGGYDQIYNLMVQEYLGEQYLTFWAGNDAVGGHGAGFYYMLDTSYREVRKIPAAGGLAGDLHDLRITEDGTALITVYEVVTADLTELGKSSQGELWDCLIQEINIATGELIFQWRAAEHYRIADTFKDIGDDGGIGRAFDFFHINSVAKDPKGNYLVSSRYMHTLTYISGETGEIIWILGGKKNMFTDLSDGNATDFAYQHDARFADNFTGVSIFNNAVDDPHPYLAPYSRGLHIKLDEEHMTAELVGEYINPNHVRAVSQGSMQVLENGNVFLGYGNAAAFTEYAANGTVLCDAHFGPQIRFGSAEVQSYRAYKYAWHGWPLTDPEVSILTDTSDNWNFYASWNGATEVDAWILQGASDPEAGEDQWEDLEAITKTEFETQFAILELYPKYLRVLAVDKEDIVLGVSSPLDAAEEKIWSLPPLRLEGNDTWALKFLMAFAALTGVIVGSREAWSIWRSRRKGVHWEQVEQTDIRLD